MQKIILLIGMPGAGKGSIGKECERYGYTHISSSSLLSQAGYNLKKSRNIPDDAVLSLIKDVITKQSDDSIIVLEGFPRSMSQLENLEKEFNIYKAIYLKLTPSVAFKRVTERLICPTCGEIYTINLYKSPKNIGVCDLCGSTLAKREGDNPKIFKKRVYCFTKNSYPIIRYYDLCKKLITVDATKATDEIVSLIKTL